MESKDKVKQARMTLRLSQEQEERLREYANANGMTKTDALRDVLDSYLFFEAKKEMAIDHGNESAMQEILKDELANEAVKRYQATSLATKTVSDMTPVERREFRKALGKYDYALNAMIVQFKKVGTNLNQLAKHANATKKLDEKVVNENLKVVNDNIKKIYSIVDEQSKEVARLWRTVG